MEKAVNNSDLKTNNIITELLKSGNDYINFIRRDEINQIIIDNYRKPIDPTFDLETVLMFYLGISDNSINQTFYSELIIYDSTDEFNELLFKYLDRLKIEKLVFNVKFSVTKLEEFKNYNKLFEVLSRAKGIKGLTLDSLTYLDFNKCFADKKSKFPIYLKSLEINNCCNTIDIYDYETRVLIKIQKLIQLIHDSNKTNKLTILSLNSDFSDKIDLFDLLNNTNIEELHIKTQVEKLKIKFEIENLTNKLKTLKLNIRDSSTFDLDDLLKSLSESKVENLYLNNSKIYYFDFTLLSKLKYLKNCNLLDNKITDIYSKSSFDSSLTYSITELNLSQNGFSNINDLFKTLEQTNIEILCLRFNNIINIECSKYLKYCSTLKKLDLANNLICRVDELFKIINYTNIDYLDLSLNSIEDIDNLIYLKNNKTLKTLKLNNNQIVDIDNLIYVLESTIIENLSLETNKIENIDVVLDYIHNCTSLKSIDLIGNNKISTYDVIRLMRLNTRLPLLEIRHPYNLGGIKEYKATIIPSKELKRINRSIYLLSVKNKLFGKIPNNLIQTILFLAGKLDNDIRLKNIEDAIKPKKSLEDDDTKKQRKNKMKQKSLIIKKNEEEEETLIEQQKREEQEMTKILKMKKNKDDN